MINRDKSFKLIIYLAIFLAFFVSVNYVYAADSAAQNAFNNLGKAAETGYGEKPAIQDVPTAIGKIVGVVLSFVGVLFLGLLVYGGFGWMTAQGNQTEVQKAKDLIQAAVLGLIVIMSAYALANFIGNVILNKI
jgi:hypothetical protein